jgi:phosphatidate cytidylyltransferase
MLSYRVLTALALIPLVVAALFWLPTVGVAAVLGAFVGVGAWEWARLAGLAGFARVHFVVVVLGCGALAVRATMLVPGFALGVFAAAAAFWVWGLATLVRGDAAGGVFAGRYRRLLSGVLVLVPTWLAAVYLHGVDPHGPRLLLYLLVLVWVADSFAYLAGHLYGRRKLAPAISPGKTVEGVLGGLAASLAYAWVAGVTVFDYGGGALALWVALAGAVALASVVGDLLESKLKRLAGVKDSGTLLPGHGGVLDRIDALTAAAPLFALGWAAWLRAP